MKKFLVLIFVFSSNCFAFENASLQFQDPSGWVRQPHEVKGVNAIYFSIPSTKNSNSSAFLISTTTVRPNKMNPNDFIRQSMATEAKKYSDYKVFALKDLAGVKVPHSLKQFTYTKNGVRIKGLALLAQSKTDNHLFHFTVGEELYPTYEAEVLAVLKSLKLK